MGALTWTLDSNARQAEVLRLRNEGFSFREVSSQMGIPLSLAHLDVARACRKVLDPHVREHRALVNAQLDDLWAVQYPLALDGDGRAFDRCLRLIERRCAVNGIDMPKRVDITSNGESLSPEQQASIKSLEDLPVAERINRLMGALSGKLLPQPTADIVVKKVDQDGGEAEERDETGVDRRSETQ